MDWDRNVVTELPFTSACFVNRPRFGLGPRPSALTCSVLLHCTLVVILASVFDHGVADGSDPTVIERYSVRLLNADVEDARSALREGASGLSGAAGAKAREDRSERGGSSPSLANQTPKAASGLPGPPARMFDLPPLPQIQKADRTIIQLDVPTNIVLKQDIPVPAVIIWAQSHISRPSPRQFVAPPREMKRASITLPAAPALELPNAKARIADIKLAATSVTNAPRLIVPPSTTSPVRIPGIEDANAIPETSKRTPTEPSTGNIISLPNTRATATGMMLVPPANQVAAIHLGGESPTGGADGNGTGDGSSTGRGSAAGNEGIAGGAGTGEALGTGSGTGSTGSKGLGAGKQGGSGSGGTGGSGGGRGGTDGRGFGSGDTGSGAGGGGVAMPVFAASGEVHRMPAVRVVNARDGRFNVVVLGSSNADAYPESTGLLSGRLIYTVYLKVGLKKNWILQYCLSKDAPKSTVKGSATPLDAPWPITILRPDLTFAPDLDYVMVHGIVNAAGRFEQLTLVVPNELTDRDFLLSSLRQWEFRPASRDGQPAIVEVLLIIPRESA